MSNPSQPATRPTSNPDAQQDKRKPWSTADLESVLNGSADPRLAREADRKGLSMSGYGAMQAAVSTAALLPLLDLLEPPGEGEIQDGDRHRASGEDARIAGAHRGQAGRVRLAERRFLTALASVTPTRLERLRALADRLDPAAAARLNVGRGRIEEVRAERALAALPSERLAAIVRLADRLDPVTAALAKSRERLAAVFAQEPWPDPASRDRREVAHSAKDLVDTSVKRAAAAAAEAEARHRQASDRVGLLDRVSLAVLGRGTTSILAERAAAAEAERQRIEADIQANSHGRRLNQADVDAPGIVRSRNLERNRWLESPEVTAAGREARGNDLVAKAIADGVPGVEALARQDLAKAREILLRQEADQRAAEERIKRELSKTIRPGTVISEQPSALRMR